MFAPSTSTPQLVIIGKNSRVVFTRYGYMPEEDIRAAIESALKEFGDLQQVEMIGNVFLDSSRLNIDMMGKFISVSGVPYTLSVNSVSDSTIVQAEFDSETLFLSKGVNSGISEIIVQAAQASGDTVVTSFRVMTYPEGSQVIGFEDSENWQDYFSFEGEAKWGADTETVFSGTYSLRSGYIPAPEVELGTNRTIAKAEFICDREDTIAFAYKISSQQRSDGLRFFLGDLEWFLTDDIWSGNVEWNFAEFPVEAGRHTVSWEYFKYEYGFAGRDAAWIDLVRIPGSLTGILSEIFADDYVTATNYPNPFNSSTVLNFKLPGDSNVKLSVFNLKGETVMTKDMGKMRKGLNTYKLMFDCFESGIYFYKLNSEDCETAGRLLYLK